MKQTVFFVALILSTFLARAQNKGVADYAVNWSSLGKDENSSMPLGNGDIALNAWTEKNGDILLLLAKGDAWSETTQLLKLGRVRISLSPSPFVNSSSFSQKLNIQDGSLVIRSGNNTVTIWVDASHPVVRVSAQTEKPVSIKAVSEIWRTQSYHRTQQQIGATQLGHWEWNSNPNGVNFYPDTVLAPKNNQVNWCHFNATSMYPIVFEREHLGSIVGKYPDPILNRCFGVAMKGNGWVSKGNLALESAKPSTRQELNIYALTQQTASPAEWLSSINKKIKTTEAVSTASAWKAHVAWWNKFWNRSWIYVKGTDEAEKVSQGYAMQRYMSACAGRGEYPIKFNGSLFTVGHDLPQDAISNELSHDADYRRWGPCYWNQNTRHLYWPMIASGDYDMLMPWFNMYVNALPLAKEKTRLYYNHEGASFIETIFFWGLPNLQDFGWNNPNPDPQSTFMRYHIQGGLEVSAQMLDYFDYTQNKTLFQKSLLPFIDAIVTYYAQHWKTGPDGKLILDPAQAIEQYQVGVVNPTPDIAGLTSVTARLLSLPAGVATEQQKAAWAKLQKEIPDVPQGTTANGKLPKNCKGDPDGMPTILPAKIYGKEGNIENPELYTVFPYRLFTVGKPDLELARNTYASRLHPLGKCWGQDGMESALLGLTEEAKKSAIESFTSYGKQEFPWFWSKNNDWPPDMDNGGAMTTLQLMAMQTEGKIIRLLPAWPKDWTADFKLYAPYNTTIEAHIEGGKISNLKVTPATRAKDIQILAQP